MKTKIRLNKVVSPNAGNKKGEVEFFEANKGKEFNATRHNINYWKTECGNLVHLYNALELRNV